MSTTFDVTPRLKRLPAFGEIIDRSTAELHRFLESIGICARPRVHMRLQACADDAHVPFSLDDPARWNKETYAWFMVGNVRGGTDAYSDDDANEIREYWDDEMANPRCIRFESIIRESVEIGHRWSFRRSAGQPAVINLAYGLIAGSLAAITNGIVHSIDSAWDYEKLPASPEEFLSWYFRPEQTANQKSQAWSRECLARLAVELGQDPAHSSN